MASHEPCGDLPNRAPTPPHDMVRVPGGTFMMGSDKHYPEEAPAHRVSVAPFWIDRTTVTNRAFGEFVKATGYVTSAERPPRSEDYPGAKPEMLVPGSVVFKSPRHKVSLHDAYQWWTWVRGANWRRPEGKGSSISGRLDHPVVHISFEDAEAFARWSGKALPTEAEWEFAARGGLDANEFTWGNELLPDGNYLANFWQGDFPHENQMLDGFVGTAPVGSFAPNDYGLYDMAGNVWEWTQDWFSAKHVVTKACCTIDNPRGGAKDHSARGDDPLHIPRKVMKGGSYLCAPNYCRRYRPAARMGQAIDTSTCHLGFRCVVRVGAATA